MAIERCGKQARVIAVDLAEIEPLPGVTCVIGDFHDESTQARVKEALDGPADVVLSDMAAPASGHTGTDHLRIMALAEAAFDFAVERFIAASEFDDDQCELIWDYPRPDHRRP